VSYLTNTKFCLRGNGEFACCYSVAEVAQSAALDEEIHEIGLAEVEGIGKGDCIDSLARQPEGFRFHRRGNPKAGFGFQSAHKFAH
jgi:hypothetical protein